MLSEYCSRQRTSSVVGSLFFNQKDESEIAYFAKINWKITDKQI